MPKSLADFLKLAVKYFFRTRGALNNYLFNNYNYLLFHKSGLAHFLLIGYQLFILRKNKAFSLYDDSVLIKGILFLKYFF